MIDTSRLVVLVDGSSYLFRAYMAARNRDGSSRLSTRDGFDTSAIHGVTQMLAKLYNDYQPAYCGVVFDAKGKNFRHDLYPDYKANRPPMADDLRRQIEPLHELIRAIGFPLIIESGVEADDVIGTLAQRALAENYQVLISTGDKDMAQLLTHADITLLDTQKDEATTAENVAERFKVDVLRADQVIDFLALVGDTSDNIPGIPKVGPKTAAKWLETYGSIDAIIDNATKISGKVGENLRGHLGQLRLSRELATIKTDLDLDLSIADLALQPKNAEKIAQLCSRYELNKIRQRFLADEPAAAAEPPPEPIAAEYRILQSEAELQALAAELGASSSFAVDTETDSLDYTRAKLVGISVSTAAGKAAYLPIAHQLAKNLPLPAVIRALKPLLENAGIRKIGQHLKYDRHILAQHGISINGSADDTMLMSYVWNAAAVRHNMDALADYYLSLKTISFTDIAGKGAKQLTFDQIDLETAGHYACEDADITLRLYHCFSNKLNKEPRLRELYETLEAPLASVLWRMETRGVKIDTALLAAQSGEIAAKLAELEQQAYLEAGETFNLGSTKQLGEILFAKLGLPVVSKTPKGAPSTNEEALETLAAEHSAALPKIILEHRGLAKLKSTYTDKLPELISAQTGRIHTSYHQAVTSTGRLSSSDPNLQNIPVRTAEGRRIRQAFIPEAGYQILAADYSQIELRIMAHLSGDAGLIKAFEAGKDIHAATAAEIFGGSPDSIDREYRRRAKAINFGLIYGMSAFGLARQLGIARNEAAEYIDIYFARYPKVREYMDAARETARQKGYAETLLGRRLYIPDITSKNQQRRNAAERLAINAPMQGSAADIIKLAMLDIDRHWQNDADCRLIMQVHDELVFEVADAQAEALRTAVQQKMQNAYALKVPLIVDAKLGKNWDEAH